MAVSGSEPVSVQDLGISLNGTAAADGIGSQPVSVEDLQLVVQGMQEKADAELQSVAGCWLFGVGQGNSLFVDVTGRTGSGITVNSGKRPVINATGRYRFGVSFYHSNTAVEQFAVKLNNATVATVTVPDKAYAASYCTFEADMAAGQTVNITFGGAGISAVSVSIQRIK